MRTLFILLVVVLLVAVAAMAIGRWRRRRTATRVRRADPLRGEAAAGMGPLRIAAGDVVH